MSQQLVPPSFYNNRTFVQKCLKLIRDMTGLSQNKAVSAVSGAAALLVIALVWQKSSSRKTIPFSQIPTPKGCRPVFGHMLAIGPSMATTFHEWHKELGPIFHLRLGVKNIIVVSDPYMTHELLATMGKFTSNRPGGFDRHEWGSKGETKGIIIGNPEDNLWSTLRKSVLNALGPRKIKDVSPILCKEADEFVNLVATGKNVDPLPALMRASLNFILITVFGTRSESLDDPLYKRFISIINKSISFSDFKYAIATFIPLLKITDTLFGSQKAIAQFIENDCMPFYGDLVEKALAADGDNMAKALNEEMNQGKKGYYNNLFPTIHDLVLAGTDTTAVTMAWGFLQISTRPDIQRKIQQEIDAFVGNNRRLPHFWERDVVPYMIATQRECMRLRPTTEFGVTHEASEDFEWRGSIIPKNTWFMANMGDAHLDPEKYPNPEEFTPERFLNKEETMASSANRKVEDRDQFNFGWGRRVCVGTHLAETQMFNIWVRVLERCNIVPALDENGKEAPVTLETVPPKSGTVVVSPTPFEIRFIPRTKAQ